MARQVAETMQALATSSRVRILARLREGPCAVGGAGGPVAAPVAGDLGAAVRDPDEVAVEAKLDPLVHEPLGGAVEVPPVAQVAVEGDAHAPCARPFEAVRGQRPQRLSLLGHALAHGEAAA